MRKGRTPAPRKIATVVPIRQAPAEQPPAADTGARQQPLGKLGVAPSEVEGQLERVLTSVTFRQVDRLKRFLNFIVSEALAGRGDQLKEYVIGVAFQWSGSFVGPLAYIAVVALIGAFAYSVILGDIHRLEVETD